MNAQPVERVADVQAFLVDLDGTLVHGRDLLPGARDLLHWGGDRFAVVSNDAEHTPQQWSQMLRRLGMRYLPVEAGRLPEAAERQINPGSAA
jgi:ribonucleotide monophosphatase NagD (HAD superfamily)